MSQAGRLVLGEDDIRRSLTRISFQIIERNKGVSQVVLMGIRTRGVELASRISQQIAQHADLVPVGVLDTTGFRDDRPADRNPGATTAPEGGIDGKTVVLIDDVLYTGRTVRAALDALGELGRPQSVQLAVLVDRGHRELPIRADFVGKNLPTSRTEFIDIKLKVTDGEDGVYIASSKR
ncbi:bifunctional pyr operon transcriptional regulator/uracil phosphoribosyltransferase PyrR [Boudabousia marimammalium]|uniref:Bifunctional protein PyrR n=1 Tax=Boudabousia marimammalium TaxID=156892 RepID=A0A1Q5PR77_9ACTO|nr:bifunctional pyr operon transcriptional regulator/uracil phosphoribosyltransferase PyrR [Boudabousia marimammalium]OKL50003.1 bifunctional pyr operon transcriptional regulator/uracil phosphoribosyltransferase [Boudabousia marimammalium]